LPSSAAADVLLLLHWWLQAAPGRLWVSWYLLVLALSAAAPLVSRQSVVPAPVNN
jgi:hypothetical protein